MKFYNCQLNWIVKITSRTTEDRILNQIFQPNVVTFGVKSISLALKEIAENLPAESQEIEQSIGRSSLVSEFSAAEIRPFTLGPPIVFRVLPFPSAKHLPRPCARSLSLLRGGSWESASERASPCESCTRGEKRAGAALIARSARIRPRARSLFLLTSLRRGSQFIFRNGVLAAELRGTGFFDHEIRFSRRLPRELFQSQAPSRVWEVCERASSPWCDYKRRKTVNDGLDWVEKKRYATDRNRARFSAQNWASRSTKRCGIGHSTRDLEQR